MIANSTSVMSAKMGNEWWAAAIMVDFTHSEIPSYEKQSNLFPHGGKAISSQR
jgi:hypothetical protein